MNAPGINKSEHIKPAVASPGELLRARRVANNLSAEEVAPMLRLSPHQLNALETGDYDSLFGKTYIVGYWRSYANLLGVSIEDAIAAHENALPDADSGLAERLAPASGGEHFRRVFAAACLAVAVVLFGAMWYWQSPDELANGEFGVYDGADDATQSASPPVVPRPNFPPQDTAARFLPETDESALGDGEWRGLPLFGAPKKPAAIADDANDNAATNTAADNNNDNNSDGNANNVGRENLNASVNEITNQNATESANENSDAVRDTTAFGAIANANAADAPSRAAPDEIIITADRESWVEVHDKNKKRLLYRMLARAERVKLAGVRPFSVFIGDADNVSVEYRGELVQFRKSGRGAFARFSVGAR